MIFFNVYIFRIHDGVKLIAEKLTAAVENHPVVTILGAQQCNSDRIWRKRTPRVND